MEMELWRLKVHIGRGICVLRMRNELFFHFDRLYLMIHVSSGDGKAVTLLSFGSSFMWCEQFCPGRTFYFDEFYYIGKPLAKIQKPSTSIGNSSKLTRRPRGDGHIHISIQLRVINVRGRVNSLGLESF